MAESFEHMVARINACAYLAEEPLTRECIMPKSIKLSKGKEFQFTSGGGGAAASKYPWDEWFNPDPKQFPNGLLLLEQSLGTKNDKGTVTDITEKRDYEVDTDAMPPKIKVAAARRYKVVQINRKDADGNKLVDSIIIKARDMTPDERVREDMDRAEEKAKLAAEKVDASNPAPATETTSGS